MLYKVIEGRDVFELNEELKSIPEFAKLTDRQMKVVILYADRKSPFKTLSDKSKREKICQLVGYGMEGTRPDKNAREIIAGKVESIEKAIAKYKELEYDDNQDTLDTINAQIQEIKEYLKSDKRIPIVDDKGKVIEYKMDGKAIEAAVKLSKQLPDLIEAKQKIESLLQVSQDQSPEITTFSSLDIPETIEGDDQLSVIDQFHLSNQQKNDTRTV